MMIKFVRFNIYLSALLAVALVTGCESFGGKKKDKYESVITLHQEASADGASDVESVPIYRANPIHVTVAKEPFLDSSDVTDAKVLEDLGGFVIQLRWNQRGAMILNGVTTANRNRRIAIHCVFSKDAKDQEKEVRWLASPMVDRPINNGLLTFTPDCTRQEADRIVKGLNQMAEEIKKKDEF